MLDREQQFNNVERAAEKDGQPSDVLFDSELWDGAGWKQLKNVINKDATANSSAGSHNNERISEPASGGAVQHKFSSPWLTEQTSNNQNKIQRELPPLIINTDEKTVIKSPSFPNLAPPVTNEQKPGPKAPFLPPEKVPPFVPEVRPNLPAIFKAPAPATPKENQLGPRGDKLPPFIIPRDAPNLPLPGPRNDTGKVYELNRLNNRAADHSTPDAVVRVPADFDPKKPIHLVIYNHGWGSTARSAYLDNRLGEQMANAPSNSVMIVPEWQRVAGANSGDQGNFSKPGLFKNMVEEIFSKTPGLHGKNHKRR